MERELDFLHLLANPDVNERLLAARQLRINPNPQFLDALWAAHKSIQSRRNEEGSALAYHPMFAALKANVKRDPAWLKRTIANESSNDVESVADLAYLVANLADGGNVWLTTKTLLFQRLCESKPRALATNIATYRDKAESDWVETQISSNVDLVCGRAWNALIHIDPDRAIRSMEMVPVHEGAMTRIWNFQPLLYKRPAEARREIYRLAKASSDPLGYGTWFQGFENAMDGQIVDLLLDALLSVLQRDKEKDAPNFRPLYRPLSLLAKINSPELVERIAMRRGTALEDQLAEWLISIGARQSLSLDNPEREPALRLLEVMQGNGFLKVTNAYLRSPSQYGMLDAIHLARRVPTADVRARLLEIALQDTLWDERVALLQGYATTALAEAGDFSSVVKSVLKWGLLTLRQVHEELSPKPFDDYAISPARAAIQSYVDTNEPRTNAIVALGMARRPEFLPLFLEILQGSPQDSEVALACVVAIGDLAINSEAAILLLRQQLEIPNHRFMAQTALLSIASEAAFDALLEHLDTSYDNRLLLTLSQVPYARRRLLAKLETELTNKNFESVIETVQLLSILIKNDPDKEWLVHHLSDAILSKLRDYAVGKEGDSWIVGSKASAIRICHMIDAKFAKDAAIRALSEPTNHDRERYPFILVELFGESIVEDLFVIAKREKVTRVSQAIGRSLSEFPIQPQLIRWAQSDDPNERLAACRMLAWQSPTQALREIVMLRFDDEVSEIASSAVATFKAWGKAEVLEMLLAKFPGATQREQWILLDSMIAVGDPGNREEKTPQWVSTVAKQLNPFRKKYFLDKVERRAEKLRSDADWEDRNVD